MKFYSYEEMHREKENTIYNNVHRRPNFLSVKIPRILEHQPVLSVPKFVKTAWMSTTEEFGGKF
jgi:hypothetical protein